MNKFSATYLIQAGIRGKFKYQGVLGLDYEGSKEPDLLQTWNGSKPVYIFDEEEVAMGLATLPPSAQQHWDRSKSRGSALHRRARTVLNREGSGRDDASGLKGG